MKCWSALMDTLEETIRTITDEMKERLTSCPKLFRQRELLMSINGVECMVAQHDYHNRSFYTF